MALAGIAASWTILAGVHGEVCGSPGRPIDAEKYTSKWLARFLLYFSGTPNERTAPLQRADNWAQGPIRASPKDAKGKR